MRHEPGGHDGKSYDFDFDFVCRFMTLIDPALLAVVLLDLPLC
jgi:hypothetical protein